MTNQIIIAYCIFQSIVDLMRFVFSSFWVWLGFLLFVFTFIAVVEQSIVNIIGAFKKTKKDE